MLLDELEALVLLELALVVLPVTPVVVVPVTVAVDDAELDVLPVALAPPMGG